MGAGGISRRNINLFVSYSKTKSILKKLEKSVPHHSDLCGREILCKCVVSPKSWNDLMVTKVSLVGALWLKHDITGWFSKDPFSDQIQMLAKTLSQHKFSNMFLL